jgi:signal transduction histidine kinase
MTFALVRQATGAPRGAVAVARDVTERIEQQRTAAPPERQTPAQ